MRKNIRTWERDALFTSWIHSSKSHISLELPVAILCQIKVSAWKSNPKSGEQIKQNPQLHHLNTEIQISSLFKNLKGGWQAFFPFKLIWVCHLQAKITWESHPILTDRIYNLHGKYLPAVQTSLKLQPHTCNCQVEISTWLLNSVLPKLNYFPSQTSSHFSSPPYQVSKLEICQSFLPIPFLLSPIANYQVPSILDPNYLSPS